MINDIVLIRRSHYGAIASDPNFGINLINHLKRTSSSKTFETYAKHIGSVYSPDHTLLNIHGDRLVYEVNLLNHEDDNMVTLDLLKTFAHNLGYKIVKRGRESQ